MNLSHLKYVLEVEKHASINKAANALYMAQPNLSQALKSLEQEIGIVIFNRTKNGVELTADGKTFLSYAKLALSNVESMKNISKMKADNFIGIRISHSRLSYVSEVIVRYHHHITKNKDIRLEVLLHEERVGSVLNSVYTLESDIGFIAIYEEQKDFFLKMMSQKNLRYVQLSQWPLQVLMSETHPLANRIEIERSELINHTIVVHGRFDDEPYGFPYFIQSLGIALENNCMFINSRATQVDMISRCHGTFGITPKVFPEILAANHLVTVPLAAMNGRTMSVGYVLHKDKVRTSVMHDLIAIAEDVFKL